MSLTVKPLELGKPAPKQRRVFGKKPIAQDQPKALALVEPQYPLIAGTLDNPQHELYAQLIASGYSQTAAYQKIYDVETKSAHAASGRLSASEVIQARVKQLQAATAVGRVMTNIYRREFLFEVVDTPIGTLDKDSRLVQKYKFSTRYEKKSDAVVEDVEVTVPGKLEAIKLDAQLAGELEPDSDDEKIGKFSIGPITINMIANIVNGKPVKLPPTFDVDAERV